MSENIEFKIRSIIYHNEENNFSVLRCSMKGELEYTDYTVVATIFNPRRDMQVIFKGSWIKDPKWGQQFKAESYEEVLPTSKEGIQAFLSSGLIKGIGEITAKNIVDFFGEQTLDILNAYPQRLLDVPGIGKKKAEKIIVSWGENKEIQKIMVFLQAHGVSTNLALKIYKQYKSDSIAKLTENPYVLADDLYGVGFKIADSVALKIGFDVKSFKRIQSAIFFCLKSLAEDGHIYGEYNQVVNAVADPKILGFDEFDKKLIEDNIQTLIDEKKILKDFKETDAPFPDTCLYLPYYFTSELYTAMKLIQILKNPCQEKEVSIEQIQSGVYKRTHKNIRYDDSQIQAIRTASSSRVMILTGGPGTGKTTVANGIIQSYLNMGLKVVCCSPTGKASKRLSESTGLTAKTIHRLLEINAQGKFDRNEDNPLDEDVLVVDECSMIDQRLMASLLRAVRVNMRIVFIGDVDQLPSVGAGNVFKDMINSTVIPTVKLNVIHRQGKTSLIVENSQNMLKGMNPKMNIPDGDFFFVAANKDNIQETVKSLVSALPKRRPEFKTDDIQILCPTKRNNGGTVALNTVMQDLLNKDGQKIENTRYRIGDKVMQLKNDYDKDVFNGDTGIITGYDDEEGTVQIKFEDRIVEYEKSELDSINLSYAISIHKSQGSDYPAVIMPLMMDSYIMLQRNLIYTAVTRAKRFICIVGESKAIYTAIANNKTTKRNSRLCELLRDAGSING